MAIELTVAIIAGVTALIVAIITPIVEKYIENIYNKKKSDVLRDDIKVNALVDTKLEEIKDTYNTNRIWICQFHNGGYYYPTGKSMQKFSITYEITSGTNTFQHQFQNIPISLFSKAMDYLSQGNIINVPDFNTHETFGLDSFGNHEDSKSVYMFPMVTIDNKFIGMVGIGFKQLVELSENNINELKLEINSISNVLMNEYLNKG